MPHKKTASPWYLYIVETKYHTWYTGITTNWQRRFAEHQSNSVKSAKALKGKGPLKLVYCVELKDHSAALQAELWLKKQGKLRKKQVVAQSYIFPFEHQLIDFSQPIND